MIRIHTEDHTVEIIGRYLGKYKLTFCLSFLKILYDDIYAFNSIEAFFDSDSDFDFDLFSENILF